MTSPEASQTFLAEGFCHGEVLLLLWGNQHMAGGKNISSLSRAQPQKWQDKGLTLYTYCWGVSGKARPPMRKEMLGRPARLQLGSCLRKLGTPGPGAAVAPVSAVMLLNKAVGTEIKGLPVSRNVMHAGDVAEQPGSTRPGALAVTWSSATCQPTLDAVGKLRAAKEVSMLLVHKIST